MHVLGSIIVWIIFGLIVGAIARLLFPGRQPMGAVATIVLGIVGALIGGFISWIFTGGPDQPYQPAGWIMAIVGAVIALWIYLGVTRERLAP